MKEQRYFSKATLHEEIFNKLLMRFLPVNVMTDFVSDTTAPQFWEESS
jgi:hypothetical protein